LVPRRGRESTENGLFLASVTTPSNFLFGGMIRLILPDAHIIHCRRNAVDTCLSCYTKLFAAEQSFTYDQTELGRFHRAYQGLMAQWRATLRSSHFLEVELRGGR
jgi:hypothetical protein